MDVAEGDEIVFSKYGGTEIKVGADEYLILRESRRAREGRRRPRAKGEAQARRRHRLGTHGGRETWLTRS